MLRRARELLYWPGMAQDIKQTAEHCEAWSTADEAPQPERNAETAQQGQGQGPCVKVGIDLFELDGQQ